YPSAAERQNRGLAHCASLHPREDLTQNLPPSVPDPAMNPYGPRLLSGRVLAASAAWSLTAQVIPAMAGIITIPFIIRSLGVERFGVLTLAWMVIGYFGLFDLGLGRAVTKFAAELLASPRDARMNGLVWTTWYLMLAIGLVGAAVLTTIARWLVTSAIKVPPDLRPETLQSQESLPAHCWALEHGSRYQIS